MEEKIYIYIKIKSSVPFWIYSLFQIKYMIISFKVNNLLDKIYNLLNFYLGSNSFSIQK